MTQARPVSVSIGALELMEKRHSFSLKVSDLIGFKFGLTGDIFKEGILGPAV